MADFNLTPARLSMLTAVVAATEKAAHTFEYLTALSASALEKEGLILRNPDPTARDEEGRYQYRASAAGIAAAHAAHAANGGEVLPPSTSAPAIAPVHVQETAHMTHPAPHASSDPFAISDAIPLPAPRSVTIGGKAERYPWGKLAIGQSFFVARTAKLPNPEKNLASTKLAAMRRYAPAVFISATYENDPATGLPGARFFRAADRTPEEMTAQAERAATRKKPEPRAAKPTPAPQAEAPTQSMQHPSAGIQAPAAPDGWGTVEA